MAPKLKPDAATNCVIYSQPKGDDAETVECEACRLWARLGCAGVTGKDEVFCPYCTQSRQVPKLRKNARKPESDAGTTSGAAKPPKDVQDQQELVEQERKTAELIRIKRMEMEKMFHEKQIRIEKEMQERELAAANELRALKLKLEKEFESKQRAAEQEFLSKQQEIQKLISKSKQGYRILEVQEKTKLAVEDEVDMDAKRIGKETAEEATGPVSLEVLEIVRIENSPEHDKPLEGFEEEALVTDVEKVAEDDEEGTKTPESGEDKFSDGPGKPVVQGRLVQQDAVPDIIDDLRHVFGPPENLLHREDEWRFPDSYLLISSNDEESPVKRWLGRKPTAAVNLSPSPSPQRKQKSASSPETAVYDGGGTSLERRRIVSSSEKKFVEAKQAKKGLETTTTHAEERFETSDEERRQKWLGEKEEEWRRNEEEPRKQREKVEHSLMKAIAQSSRRSLVQIKTNAQTKGDFRLMADQYKSSLRMIFRPTPHTIEVVRKIGEFTRMASMAEGMDKIQSMYEACQHSEARFIIKSLAGKLWIGLAEQSLLQVSPNQGGDCAKPMMNALGKFWEATVKTKVEDAALVLLEFGVDQLLQKGHGIRARRTDRPPCGEDDREPAGGSEWCREYGAADDKNARGEDRGPMRHDDRVDSDDRNDREPKRLEDCEDREDCRLMWCGDRTQRHDGEPGGLGGMRRNDRDWGERGDGGGADRCDFGRGGYRRDDCGVPRCERGARGGDAWHRGQQEDRNGRGGTSGRSSWEKRQAVAARFWNRAVVKDLIESEDGRIHQALVKRAAARLAVLNIDGKPDPEAASEPGLRAGECCGYSLPRRGRHHAAAAAAAWGTTPSRELTARES